LNKIDRPRPGTPGHHFRKLTSGKALLTFNHGLGDLCNFMGLLPEIRKAYPGWLITITHEKFRQFDKLYPGLCLPVNTNWWELPRYDFTYNIEYPEPEAQMGWDKPNLCALREFGLDDIEWSPAKLSIPDVRVRERVGVHFCGDSSPQKKSATVQRAEQIWRAIEKAGFEPFEIHMQKADQPQRFFPFLPLSQTLRYHEPDLRLMAETIASCRFFVGIDSGPLYLALMILGVGRCIGLELKNPIARYAPCDITTVDIKKFTQAKLTRILKSKKEDLTNAATS
jgi:hypothetical protein